MGLERLTAPGSPAVIARLDGVAARLAGQTCAALYADPSLWTSHLQTSARMLGTAAMIVDGAPWVLAEAMGAVVDWDDLSCRGGDGAGALRETVCWKNLLDVVGRLIDARSGMVIALLPGPSRLAGLLFGAEDDAALGRVKAGLVAAVEAVAQKRPDLLMLDDSASIPRLQSPAYRRLVGTVRNIVRYFNIPLGVVSPMGDDALDALARLQVDAVFAGADATPLAVNALLRATPELLLAGVAVRLSKPAEAQANFAAAHDQCPAGRWCAWAGEISGDADFASLRSRIAEMGAG